MHATPLKVLLFSLGLALSIAPLAPLSYAAEPEEAAAETVQLDENGNPIPQDPGFVTLKELSLPVYGQKRIDQMIILDLSIEVTNSREASKAYKIEPKLRDAVYTSLYNQLENGSIMRSKSGVLDLMRVRKVAYAASAKVLGKETVRDVLIQKMDQMLVY